MSVELIKIGDVFYSKDCGDIRGKVVLVNRRRISLWDYRIETHDGTIIDLKALEGLKLVIVERCSKCNIRSVTLGTEKCVNCEVV